ncbi:glycosyltransferase family 2 protein [Fredinandcohnia sp. 179-A 10B2 NHS]|uniref:glycosyltransferase family 2 protein n=1 Tax=Fredinandcohnia sp. 179-A 10B2 NHS TaxID=3235176 RepID=UPI0039A0D020
MNPKISIIVPVYKVEKYLQKCVDSILTQTFKDFELILINDGSPDNCGDICDEFANMDSRVKVIHKENGGQASARNRGLDIARGDYIGFVDSDDWIEPDMYEILYSICQENKCDIANCSSIIHYPNRRITNGGHSLIIHNRNQAMRALIEGDLYDEVVWTKLIKRELFNELRFTEGIMYEDTDFTYKLIHRSKKVCCIGAPKYNYIKREDSTMERALKNISIDRVLIYENMSNFISSNYPKVGKMVALKLANSAMVVLNLIVKSDDFNRYKDNYYKVAAILNKHFSETVRLKEYPNKVKLLLAATKVHPIMYKIIINNLSKG